jgi:inorganic pyrophosphatase
MSMDMIIETRIVKPGRPTGIYEAAGDGSLRLKEIVLPDVSLPFDMAILPNTLAENGENLRAILIGDISHPPQTQVPARIFGGFQSNGTEPCLLGVPVADERYAGLIQITDLPPSFQEELIRFVTCFSDETEELQWLDEDAINSTVRQAVARLRQVKLESDREESTQPSWLPVDRGERVVSNTKADHFTDAEYTYLQLPYRFQHYINQHLANDERILFALSRPAMRSHLQRTWLSRKNLQEGVLILTDQRLIQLVELVPPGSSGVRYGFGASMGILERLDLVSIDKLENESLVLRTGWRARDGLESLAWEFPQACAPALEELRGLLSKFTADSHRSSALRRASVPPGPETIPELKDPAAHHPEEVKPVFDRFLATLPGWLASDEKFLAWAFLPGWFENKGVARVLLVTNRYIRLIVDPIHGNDPEMAIPYAQASSMEYVGSILSSHIGLSVFHSGECQQLCVNFPYPAEHRFHKCFEAMRRCVAITPI